VAIDSRSSNHLGQRRTPEVHLPELDSLRGLAALGVTLTHYTPATPLTAAGVSYLYEAFSFFSIANLAVAFFFGLSAFLLTLTALRQLERGAFQVRRFYLTRVLRIVPLYALVVLATLGPIAQWVLITTSNPSLAGAVMETRAYSLRNIWVLFTFVFNLKGWMNDLLIDTGPHQFTPNRFMNELGHLWTLSVEMQMYLVFPLVLTMLIAVAKRWPERAFPYVMLACTLGITTRVLFLVTIPLPPVGTPSAALYFSSIAYLDTFLLGAGAGYLYWRSARHRVALFLFLQRPGTGWLLIGIGAVIGWWWQRFLWEEPSTIVNIVIYTILGLWVAAVLLWVTIHTGREVTAFLRAPWLRTIGTLSYGIYLWHLGMMLVVAPFDIWLLGGPHGPTGWPRLIGVPLMLLVYLVATIGLSAVTYRFVELPCNRLRTRLFVAGERPTALRDASRKTTSTRA
jgi:peptidoglycan/LPS O-acetylase OafA/YrhL